MPSAASRSGVAPPFNRCPPLTGRGSASPLPCGPGVEQASAGSYPPLRRKWGRPRGPRFSFLRFPQPNRLWIPLLTSLDNLLLTVDHHSQPPRPPKDLPATKHSPEHTWGPEGDPICEEPTCRFTPLSARQKGAPPGPRCGVLRPPAPPREAFNRFRSPAPGTH